MIFNRRAASIVRPEGSALTMVRGMVTRLASNHIEQEWTKMTRHLDIQAMALSNLILSSWSGHFGVVHCISTVIRLISPAQDTAADILSDNWTLASCKRSWNFAPVFIDVVAILIRVVHPCSPWAEWPEATRDWNTFIHLWLAGTEQIH